MKSILLFVLLALACSQAAVIYGPISRANLSVGYIYPGDRLLNSTVIYRYPVYNTVQAEDFLYRGPTSTRISAIQAIEIGPSQYATPWILRGGVGWSNMTIRVQSARGFGYHYRIDVWGR